MNNIVSGDTNKTCTLLLVHGKDFKPGADAYFEFAQAAMSAGLERDFPDCLDEYQRIHKRICYYGDLTNKLLSDFGEHYDEVLDLGDRRNALTQLKLLTKRKHFGVGRYDRLPGKTAASEFAADIATPVMVALGFRKPLIARLAKDVHEYWYGDGNFASMVRKRVRDKICEALDQDEKILLVSHGSGSIVTYDVLWQLSHDERFSDLYAGKKVDTWVTMSGPMGDLLVQRLLMGAKKKGRKKYPENVVTWHNVAAEDDYHCHDNTLADDFKPMLKQRQVSSIRDHKIYNLCVRYGKSNPHSSLGYYIHPRMSQIIVEWLKSGSSLPTHQSTSE